MRRLSFLLTALLLMPTTALAQRATTYEQVAVSSTAVSINAATLAGMNACIVVVETAEVRWRINAAPTSNVGTPLPVGTVLTLTNITDATLSQFIRATADDAALSVTCYPSAGEIVMSGSGGAAAGEITGEVVTSLTLQETDDASIAGGQVADALIGFTMAFDGTVWRRLTFGTAGTASAQVLTIQGVASMTPVQIADNGGALTVDGTVTADLGATDNAVLDAMAASLVLGATVAEQELQTAELEVIADDVTRTADGIEALEAALSTDGTHGQAVTLFPDGPMVMGEAKDFDGSALPNTVSEGQASRQAFTLSGMAFSFLANEDGTKELGKLEDDAHASADYGLPIWTRRIDTAASSAGSSGDYATLNTDSLGRVWTRPGRVCDDEARITNVAVDTASSGNVELVALSGSDLIYVCGYDLVADGAVAVQFIYGTGAACGTGETDLSGPMSFAANGGISRPVSGAVQFKAPAGNALCIENSTTGGIRGSVQYVRTAAP
jgi:hypothetical protein